ncbi:halocyanin domain-containing protein [Halobacteria archaeon AArc-m2/3/4]|uniref:Halocyanin domain-containing protein n=1 Tax=Natronoglomus mannanivorans TaxID=2979990 RepID=A0ABT2QAC8_9EURY|nr:halocyanin domain-containing protein [Halobacteria archaeon AArc-m2/3/4]
MDPKNVRRRTVLELATVAGISGLLAGCLGDGGYDEEVYEGETLVDDEPEYDGFLSDVDYPGTVDWTGENAGGSESDEDAAVTVLVGSGDNGMYFGPAAIRIDRGTTVRWEWTGDGGPHDVVDTDGAFESGQTPREGHTFDHTFDETGTYTYICRPHETQGMKGVVDVV